ncbi:hypothetical protein HY061_02330 [Candidatus Azambacteria bacterium]|nr:hypothetical protein [Candidatus Azambacteria bacterium]
MNRNNSGYIAIISTIIISLLLMGIIFAVNSSSFLTRSNLLNSEFKEQSFALAEACVDSALLKLAQNASYSGNENVLIGNDQCSILPMETLSSQKIIKTKAILKKAITNLKITVNSSNLSIISWEEVSKF